MGSQNKIDNLYLRALNEAKQFLRKKSTIPSPPPPEPTLPSPPPPPPPAQPPQRSSTSPVHNELTTRWNERNSTIAKGITKTATDILIIGTETAVSKNISSKTCYCIIGDYKTGSPSGGGSYVIDIDDAKYFQPHYQQNTCLYYGKYTKRAKVAQRNWPHGDIRSYLHVDPDTYIHYFDPGTGRIPSVTVGTYLHARLHHPDKEITICIDPSRLTSYDQVVLNQLDVNIVHAS